MPTSRGDISDERILDLLQNQRGYEEGFRLLLQKYQERLYRHIRRLVTDHDDAGDVVQNCFIKVYRSIGSFERKSRLFTWLYRIATNEAITFLNKKKRNAIDSIDGEHAGLAGRLQADPFFDGDDLQIRLQEALSRLPEKQRVVFHLRYFEEMSYNDMSQVLDTSVGALKASYHHAVKKIESYFSNVTHT